MKSFCLLALCAGIFYCSTCFSMGNRDNTGKSFEEKGIQTTTNLDFLDNGPLNQEDDNSLHDDFEKNEKGVQVDSVDAQVGTEDTDDGETNFGSPAKVFLQGEFEELPSQLVPYRHMGVSSRAFPRTGARSGKVFG